MLTLPTELIQSAFERVLRSTAAALGALLRDNIKILAPYTVISTQRCQFFFHQSSQQFQTLFVDESHDWKNSLLRQLTGGCDRARQDQG